MLPLPDDYSLKNITRNGMDGKTLGGVRQS